MIPCSLQMETHNRNIFQTYHIHYNLLLSLCISHYCWQNTLLHMNGIFLKLALCIYHFLTLYLMSRPHIHPFLTPNNSKLHIIHPSIGNSHHTMYSRNLHMINNHQFNTCHWLGWNLGSKVGSDLGNIWGILFNFLCMNDLLLNGIHSDTLHSHINFLSYSWDKQESQFILNRVH